MCSASLSLHTRHGSVKCPTSNSTSVSACAHTHTHTHTRAFHAHNLERSFFSLFDVSLTCMRVAWAIASFVSNGQRLEIPDDCLMKDIISGSWDHDPAHRPKFADIVQALKALLSDRFKKTPTQAHLTVQFSSPVTNTVIPSNDVFNAMKFGRSNSASGSGSGSSSRSSGSSGSLDSSNSSRSAINSSESE
jgi:hypothetical protein